MSEHQCYHLIQRSTPLTNMGTKELSLLQIHLSPFQQFPSGGTAPWKALWTFLCHKDWHLVAQVRES
jgi:hypothetical protein